ncbi:hypothetical protein COU57_06705 [Candidatus Pacearchaeota archaeon CG10_big_fil_rev_8_21_14_0_10_32_14]|nr:MAG: hypothetical protein COU57_06705 [Candidatus Pacearchaeota archaeon CG10_big_fil_rev_8_21_14_0_10_32_14]
MNIDNLLQRIEKTPSSRVIGEVGSKKEKYPLYKLKHGTGKKVLLSGVLHGDEVSGVHSILKFFNGKIKEYENDFEFTAFPIVNPWGYVHQSRRNAYKLNINREFKRDSNCEETKLIMPELEQYIFSMDFHEDFDAPSEGTDEPQGKAPSEFYLWEVCRQKPLRIGKKIIKNLEEEGISVCKWPKIYGDKNDGGVISYPENCGTSCYASDSIFESYLEKYHTPLSFTIETIQSSPLSLRVKADLISLKTVLDARR